MVLLKVEAASAIRNISRNPPYLIARQPRHLSWGHRCRTRVRSLIVSLIRSR